jgi:hypothetical protein
VEALEAIFGENFKLFCSPISSYTVVEIKIQNQIKLIASLPSNYPSIQPPKCSLSIISNDSQNKTALKLFINSIIFPRFEQGGMGCIFDYVQHVVDTLPPSVLQVGSNIPTKTATSIHEKVHDKQEKALLFIEHMNDSVSYRKILKRWSSNHGLFLEIWYRLPKGVVVKNRKNMNSSKKRSRIEDIYVLLEGEKDGISIFLQKLKCEYVDINRQGIKCKERKSKILMRKPIEMSDDKTSIINTTPSTIIVDNDVVEVQYAKGESRLVERLANFGYVIGGNNFFLSKKIDNDNGVGSNHRIILIKFDHIKSKTVRKEIKLLASSLSLGGILRPGKPGLICAKGNSTNVFEFEKQIRLQFSACTRNGGCWGPANHHFQSISIIGDINQSNVESNDFFDNSFIEAETESVMHAAHIFVKAGLKDFFFSSLSNLNDTWEIPQTVGNPDPYLKPRGGTRRKCSNRRL